jgi:D-inositol-3-phosphate glycosyltransferase
MKLALIGPVYPFRGGIAHFNAGLATALSQTHQVDLLSFKRQYPSWLYPGQSDREPESSQGPDLLPTYLLDSLNPLSWVAAKRWLREVNPDAAIFQWWITFWAPAYAYLVDQLHKQNVPVVFLIHNVMPHEPRLPDRTLARMALKKADAYITLNPRETKRLVDLLGSRHLQVTESSLPLYEPSEQQRWSRSEAREKLSLPKNEKVLLSFGLVRPYKGIGLVIEALGDLKKKGNCPYFLVAGECWDDLSVYQRRVQELDLTDKVRFDNRYIPNEELGLYFSATDGYVAAYTGGTQSGVLRMAAGFGLPIIASCYIIEGFEVPQGYPIQVFPTGDVGSLVITIEGWSQNPVARVEMTASDIWGGVTRAVEEAVQGVHKK